MKEITGIEFNNDIEQFLKSLHAHRIVLLIDQNVFNLYQSEFEEFDSIVVPQGEQSKNIQLVEEIVQMLLDMDIQRDALLVGVGGGVVTDLAGFAATVYMRGMRFGFLPTTLLGMCDAAIGGKNGVNSVNIKNVIGTINQPEFIAVFPGFLKTLPDDEFENGMAEVIKHALLSGSEFCEFLYYNKEKIISKNEETFRKMIQMSADVKLEIVQSDVYDHEKRHLLNLGHTIGHALEALNGESHGRSVAAGICIDAKISKFMGLTGHEFVKSVYDLVALYNLPVETSFSTGELMDKILSDKKRREDYINYILPVAFGDCRIVRMSPEALKKYLHQIENE